MEDKRLSLRLDSCREVLRAINGMLISRSFSGRMMEQMRQLEKLMSLLDAHSLDESDMLRVEASTNQLFNELKRIFRQQNLFDMRQREKLH